MVRDVQERHLDLHALMRLACLMLALLLSACAHGGQGGGVTYCPRPVETLPVCGFEAPYLPDPCKLEVRKGEWLAIRNPRPEPTKHHGWLWWALIGVLI